jgi:hypothetical protein
VIGVPYRPVPLWYVLAAVMVSMLLTSAAGLIYTNHVQRQSEQRWCGLVTTLDDAYRATPPQTPTGRDVAARIAALRTDLGC